MTGKRVAECRRGQSTSTVTFTQHFFRGAAIQDSPSVIIDALFVLLLSTSCLTLPNQLGLQWRHAQPFNPFTNRVYRPPKLRCDVLVQKARCKERFKSFRLFLSPLTSHLSTRAVDKTPWRRPGCRRRWMRRDRRGGDAGALLFERQKEHRPAFSTPCRTTSRTRLQ